MTTLQYALQVGVWGLSLSRKGTGFFGLGPLEVLKIFPNDRLHAVQVLSRQRVGARVGLRCKVYDLGDYQTCPYYPHQLPVKDSGRPGELEIDYVALGRAPLVVPPQGETWCILPEALSVPFVTLVRNWRERARNLTEDAERRTRFRLLQEAFGRVVAQAGLPFSPNHLYRVGAFVEADMEVFEALVGLVLGGKPGEPGDKGTDEVDLEKELQALKELQGKFAPSPPFLLD
jgi:hypothetical protein